MTPKTTRQNLLYWAGALGVAVLLSFLGGLAQHWPEGGDVDWRGVVLDVAATLAATVPLVAAGLGLPRLGKEGLAGLVSEVGVGQAKAVLEVEAIRQQTGVSGLTPEQTADIVAAIKAEMIRDPDGRLAVPRVILPPDPSTDPNRDVRFP